MEQKKEHAGKRWPVIIVKGIIVHRNVTSSCRNEKPKGELRIGYGSQD